MECLVAALLLQVGVALRIPLHRSSYSGRSLASTRFPLSNYLNVVLTQTQYYANFTLGTPPQALTVLLDTSFSHIFLPSTVCITCPTQHKFASHQSSTFSNLSTPVQLISSAGAVNGTLSADVMSLGSLNVTEMRFVLGEKVKGYDTSVEYDGVVVRDR